MALAMISRDFAASTGPNGGAGPPTTLKFSVSRGSTSMKRVLASALIVGVSLFGLAGCGEESKVESTDKVSTPTGTTEVTKEVKVEQSGSNPPPAPSGDAAAPK